ncbi:heparin lyase I family protein [Ruegeria halocynthiae]|uniref:heparin lyase I family protein n=1 Tax=Ruegeria halocynthiae TaxID=985054 RepID=UPI001268A0FF|nr:heparin lyase I family protein [Ruegeria halocynthiae]
MSKTMLAAVIIVVAFNDAASADRLKFEQNGSNLPDSYKQVRKVEGIKAKRVHSFSIYGGDCVTASYGDGTGKGDCTYGSVRSWLRESKSDGRWIFPQPSEAWYGWDMLIPSSFPTVGQQTSGSYTFVGWKGFVCSHASINHSTRKGEGGTIYLRLQAPRDPANHDCRDIARIPLMKMSDFKGQWRNIQVYAKWSHQSDGQIIVYVDGKQHANYNGPTLNIAPDYPHKKTKMNHFDFGVYLCCTAGVKHVRPGTVYFANVKRAGSQKKLGR